jgi:hypothetical protein
MKPPGRAQGENVADMQQLFTERLKRQKAIARQRAERRKRKQAEIQREATEFIGKLHKTKPPEDLDIKVTARVLEQKEAEERKAKAEQARKLREAEKARLELIRDSPRKPARSHLLDVG